MKYQYLSLGFIFSLFLFSCVEDGHEKESIITYGLMTKDPINNKFVMDIGSKFIYNQQFDEFAEGETYLVEYTGSAGYSPSGEGQYAQVELFSPPLLIPSGEVNNQMTEKDTVRLTEKEFLFISSVSYDHVKSKDYVAGRSFITVNYPYYTDQEQKLVLYYNPNAEPYLNEKDGRHYYDLFLRLYIDKPGERYTDELTAKELRSFNIDDFINNAFEKEKAAKKDTFYIRLNYVKNFLKRDSTKAVWDGNKTIMQLTNPKKEERK